MGATQVTRRCSSCRFNECPGCCSGCPAALPDLRCRCVESQYDLDGTCPYFERRFPDQPIPADSQSKAGEAAGKDAHQFDPNTGQPEALEDERTKVWKKIGDTCARKVAGLVIDAYPDDNPKTVFGLTKPSMSQVPPAALLHLMQAMTDGKRKYGLMNWREKKVSASVYYDAAMRHLMAFWDGEDEASDSGVHHLGHAMACCCLILDAAACGNLNDDRPKAGSFSELAAAMTKEAGGEMSSIYEQALKEAHRAWGAPVGGPITDNPQLCLRQRLISEEVRELDLEFDLLRSRALAGQQPTVEEKAQFLKELTDVLYVVVGTAVTFGLPLDLAFRAVHASNMSKLDEDGRPIHREDGKILKGPNYKPADLTGLVV